MNYDPGRNMLVKNNEIDNRVSRYLSLFRSYGCVSFELTPAQYEALQSAGRSFRAARQDPGFDAKSWIQDESVVRLLKIGEAFNVFAFLTQVWTSRTGFSAERDADYIIFHVRDRTRTH